MIRPRHLLKKDFDKIYHEKIEEDYNPEPPRRAVNFRIKKDIYEKFRKKVGEKYGYKQGAYAHATEEAIELWLAVNER